MRLHSVIVLACMMAAGLSANVHAQTDSTTERLWLTPSIGAHVGFVNLEQAKNAASVGLSMDVGAIRSDRLRLVFAVDRVSSTSTRPNADGTFADVSVSGEVRVATIQIGPVSPYFGAGFGLHFRSTTATDPNIKAIYDGVAAGAQIFGGTQVDFDRSGKWGAIGELRQTLAQNVNRVTLSLGIFRRLFDRTNATLPRRPAS